MSTLRVDQWLRWLVLCVELVTECMRYAMPLNSANKLTAFICSQFIFLLRLLPDYRAQGGGIACRHQLKKITIPSLHPVNPLARGLHR